MSALEERKTYYVSGQLRIHCFHLNGKRHGEFKRHYKNGQMYVHCFYLNGDLHGEYKNYYDNGQLGIHCFYLGGVDITDEVVGQFGSELSQEDQLLIKIKWGIECLP